MMSSSGMICFSKAVNRIGYWLKHKYIITFIHTYVYACTYLCITSTIMLTVNDRHTCLLLMHTCYVLVQVLLLFMYIGQ